MNYYLHLIQMQTKEIIQAKVTVRHHSRELIRSVFLATESFPIDDPDGIGLVLRKKVLAISSFLTHGTVKSDKEEQNEDFLTVMGELREVLKLITIANHLRYCSDNQKMQVRSSIALVIDGLDKLVLLLGGFEKK